MNEDVDSEQRPEENTKAEYGVKAPAAGKPVHQIVDVRDGVAGQHQLEQVGGQVVVEEERPVIEEEWKIVEKIASEEDLSSGAESLELRFINIVTESPPPEEIEHEEG